MLKNTVKILGISCLLALSFAGRVKAEDVMTPQKRALIQELITITNANKNYNQIFKAMFAQMEANLPNILSSIMKDSPGLQGEELKKKQTEIMQRFLTRFQKLAQEQINYPQIMEQISSSLFAKFYTENELKDLIAFYKSPTGQKTIAVTPQIATESMKLSNQLLMPKMIGIMQQVIKEEMQRIPQKKK